MNKALPAGYANWTERKRQRHAVRNSLVAEVKDKSNPLIEVCNSVSFSEFIISMSKIAYLVSISQMPGISYYQLFFVMASFPFVICPSGRG